MTPSSNTLTPRLASSRQWTELPTDFVLKIREVFANEFTRESTLGEFLVDGRVYPEEIIVRVGYLEKGRLKQINFEASMDLPKAKSTIRDDDDAEESVTKSESKTLERLYTCIDALGSLMEEYFDLADDEEIDVPLRWRAYEFENEVVYLQHSTVNTRLEDEADRLLGLAAQALVREESQSEDALAKAEIDSELAFDVQDAIRSGRLRVESESDGTAD